MGDTRLSSCLERDGVKVATVEHLMSAFAGLGIDNAYVDLTAGEVPIMDGSAGPFVFLIQSAGIDEQNAAKKFIRILKTVEAQRRRQVGALRAVQRFPHGLQHRLQPPGVPAIEPAHVRSISRTTSYIKEIARARTFGFMQDVENMRAQGLGLGGSLDNASRDGRIPRAEFRRLAL